MPTKLARPRKKHYKAMLRVDDGIPEEMLIFCPACKALDVIRFDHQNPIPTRKFSQRSGRVYHDCGSKEPCRLHMMRRGVPVTVTAASR
jgi:hypothetical protein